MGEELYCGPVSVPHYHGPEPIENSVMFLKERVAQLEKEMEDMICRIQKLEESR